MLTISMLGRNFSRHFDFFLFFFSENIFIFKLSPYMKCQSLFSGNDKKNIINLSFAEFARTVVKVKNGIMITNILRL